MLVSHNLRLEGIRISLVYVLSLVARLRLDEPHRTRFVRRLRIYIDAVIVLRAFGRILRRRASLNGLWLWFVLIILLFSLDGRQRPWRSPAFRLLVRRCLGPLLRSHVLGFLSALFLLLFGANKLCRVARGLNRLIHTLQMVLNDNMRHCGLLGLGVSFLRRLRLILFGLLDVSFSFLFLAILEEAL